LLSLASSCLRRFPIAQHEWVASLQPAKVLTCRHGGAPWLFRIAIVAFEISSPLAKLLVEPAQQLLALEMEVKAWWYKRDYLAVG
jgi:hypothetical protein